MIDILATSSIEPARETELHSLVAAGRAIDGTAFLEMEKSLNFDPAMKSWFFAVEGEELVGALSVFAPRREEAEISALVHPARRRSGVFSALVARAERELSPCGFADELLVCDRGAAPGEVPGAPPGSSPGAAAALSLGARLDFTEYGMTYAAAAAALADSAERRVAARPEPQGLQFAEVGPERLAELVELRMDAFGDSREDSESIQRAAFASPRRKEHVALLGDRIVAACSIAHEDAAVSLNGIGVATAERGKGIAKALILWTLGRLSGSRLPIVLDVESGNVKAFGLYTSLGFIVNRAVDYYRRPFPRVG